MKDAWLIFQLLCRPRLYLSREELDNPHKPKTWELYKEDFGVTLLFSEPE